MCNSPNISIIGPNTLSSQLVGFAIESELEEACVVASTPEEVVLRDDADEKPMGAQ